MQSTEILYSNHETGMELSPVLSSSNVEKKFETKPYLEILEADECIRQVLPSANVVNKPYLEIMANDVTTTTTLYK